MGKPLRVLIVEDSQNDAEQILRQLRRGGHEPTFERLDTATAMETALAKQTWDIVIADYRMPNFSGPAALSLMQKSGLDLPFIIVSGSMGEDIAVAAMKAGAHDYVMKNNLTRLVPAVTRELREAEMRRDHKRAEEMIQRLAYYDTLTGLPNRALLHDRLEQAILDGQRQDKPAALLLMDLDRFKEINDKGVKSALDSC